MMDGNNDKRLVGLRPAVCIRLSPVQCIACLCLRFRPFKIQSFIMANLLLKRTAASLGLAAAIFCLTLGGRAADKKDDEAALNRTRKQVKMLDASPMTASDLRVFQLKYADAWTVSKLADNVAAPERCSKPVIAALTGYVFGVGLELSLACDFRLATRDVQLALPEATIGMIPGSGGTQRLARLVGLGRAKDIVMRGRRVPAEEALALGLVTELADEGPFDMADIAVNMRVV